MGARSSRILLLGSSSQHPAPLRAWTGLRGKPRPLCRGTPALRAPAIRPLPPGQAAPVWTVPRGCFAVFHNLPACRGDWEGLWEAGPPAMDRGRLLRGERRCQGRGVSSSAPALPTQSSSDTDGMVTVPLGTGLSGPLPAGCLLEQLPALRKAVYSLEDPCTVRAAARNGG